MQVVRASQSYLRMTHKNRDLVQGKGILDPLLEPLRLCTHMKQGREGGREGEERYSTEAQLQTAFTLDESRTSIGESFQSPVYGLH